MSFIDEKLEELRNYWSIHRIGYLQDFVKTLKELNDKLNETINDFCHSSNKDSFDVRFLCSFLKEFYKVNDEIINNYLSFSLRSNISLIRANCESIIILDLVSRNIDKNIIEEVHKFERQIFDYFNIDKEAKKTKNFYSWSKNYVTSKNGRINLKQLTNNDTIKFYFHFENLSLMLHNNNSFSRMIYQHYDFKANDNIGADQGVSNATLQIVSEQSVYFYHFFEHLFKVIKSLSLSINRKDINIDAKQPLEKMHTFFEHLIAD